MMILNMCKPSSDGLRETHRTKPSWKGILTRARFEINSANMEYLARMGDKYGVKALLNDVRVRFSQDPLVLIFMYSIAPFVVFMTA
jgi:hypothetical protein